MLSEDTPLQKSWLKERDPYARIAYLVTYCMVLLGVIGGAVRCFFGWRGVQLLENNNLCLVLNENFDSPDSVFGTNGTFFREVDMSGFGYVFHRMFVANQPDSICPETASLK